MAVLPSAGNASEVGVLITTAADNAGTDKAKAGLASLDEQAKTSAATAEKATSSWSNATSSLKNVGASLVSVGGSLSKFVSLPIAAIGFESAKMAMTFQQTMEMLHTNAGTAQSAIAGLSNQVLTMAAQVGAKPEELATAFYHIASAGNGIWNTAKQLDILKIAAEGAAIGQASLDDTTYSLTSTMASNIKGAQDAAATMSTLTSIVGAGDMKMADLNAAIGTGFLGTAATFGISLRSVGAALATLTDNGEHADAAATRLRMTWALMAAPSKQASELMQTLGVSAGDAQKATDEMNTVFAKTGLTTTNLATDLQKPDGMNVALKDLKDHLEKAGLTSQETDAMLSKMFGGGRSDAAMMTLLQNIDRTDEKYKMISDSSTSFAEKWKEQQKTMNQEWKEAWGGIQSDMIRLGEAVMPTLAKAMGGVAKAVGDLSNWFQNLSSWQKQTIVDVGLVLAALGPFLMLLGGIMEAVAVLASPMGLVVLGIAALGVAAIATRSHFAQWREEVDKLWHSFTGSTPVVIITQYIQQVMVPALQAVWNSIKKNLTPAFGELWTAIKRVWEAIEPAFTTSLKVMAALLGGILAAALWAFIAGLNLFVKALGYAAAAIANVIGWIANLAGWFGNLVGIVVNTVKTIITIFSNLWPAVKDVVGLIVGAFAGLGGAILGVMKGAGNWLYQIGKDIINGMLNGIEDALKGIGSSLGKVSNDVGGAVKGALHAIHVPGFAAGGYTGSGGANDIAGVVHKGEYVIPQSGVNQSTGMPKGMSGGTTSVTIGTVVLQSQSAAQEFFRQLNQDTMNLGKGLTAVQGQY